MINTTRQPIQKSDTSRRKKGAFTLIELLVVIVIIAVLAAILFPVFNEARRSSRKTTALNNLAQIGKAVHLYTTDYDETLPPRFPMEPTWSGYNKVILIAGPGGFNERYDPYLKNAQIWFSPEDRLREKGYTSFSFNEQLAFAWPLSSIPRPAEAIYVTDRRDIETSEPPADTYVWWQFIKGGAFSESTLLGTLDPVEVASQISPIRYSGNVGLYLFLDGHAKAMSFEQTWGDAHKNLHLAIKQ